MSNIESITEVRNEFDCHGKAYSIKLTCGHQLCVTGIKIFNIKSVSCKYCGGTGEIEYWS